MLTPSWYGHRYPAMEDLWSFAYSLGAGVAECEIPFGIFHPNIEGVPVILIPKNGSLLENMWFLSHEIGHLIQHAGPKGQQNHGKEELQANRWAACALIPEMRIRAYNNASIDSFIASLSANYEHIPFETCQLRCLAAKIANFRLKAILEVA